MSSAAPLLRAEGVDCRLPSGRTLISRLAFEVAPGELVAIVGPNGSGKSTLLRCLAGLEAPQAGQIRLAGAELLRLGGAERARRLAYLPQSTHAPPELRVEQVIMLGRAPHQRWFAGPTGADARAVRLAAQRCYVEDLLERRLATLSGGETQRVMLARMLATDCPLLVLDEPTTALDVGHALRISSLLSELTREGRGVILAVHELELARRFADRVLCLHGDVAGTWSVGPPDAVLVPEVLDTTFDVETRREGGHLRFELPPGPGG